MKLLPAAALALIAATPGFASSAVLDFETVTGFTPIAEYYNGGAGGAGNIGPALGVSFGGDALGVVNDALGPYFSRAPTPLGVMAPVGSASTMVVASGFTRGLRFSYSSSDAVLNGVQVWSGIAGTGSLLASFDLLANAQLGGCSDTLFCNFGQVFTPFDGVAHSVTFGNAANFAAFDNVEIGAVPEPSAVLLMALGMAGFLAVRRRA